MIRERRERVARGWSKLGCASRARPVGRLRDQANGPRERWEKKVACLAGRGSGARAAGLPGRPLGRAQKGRGDWLGQGCR